MPIDQQKRLTLHGTAVVVVSLHAGIVFMATLVFPYFPQTATVFGPDAQRAWGAAHKAPLLMAIWILVTGAMLPRLILTSRTQKMMADLLIWGVWMITFACVLGALAGVRGLIGSGAELVNLVATYVNFVGGVLTLFSAFLQLRGARTAMREVPQGSAS